MRRRWVEYLANMAAGLKTYSERRSLEKVARCLIHNRCLIPIVVIHVLWQAAEACFKDFSPIKTEEGKSLIKKALTDSMRTISDQAFDSSDEEAKLRSIDKLLEIDFKPDRPYEPTYSVFLEILYDQFVAEQEGGWKKSTAPLAT